MARVAVGLSVRDPHVEDLLQLDRGAIDVLEVMIDEALEPGPKRRAWRKLGSRWPLLAHGTELGIGDADGPCPNYIRKIQETAAELHVHWYSEHLSFLNAGGIALGHFAPIGDDAESLETLASNAAHVRRGLPCPLLLENPADVLGYQQGAVAGKAYSHALEAAECGALLDLTNLLYNARNDRYAPREFLDALDFDRVVEIHLAGGKQWNDLWIDSHDHDIDPDALALLVHVAKRAPNLRAVIIERDDRIPPLASLLNEVQQIRSCLAGAL